LIIGTKTSHHGLPWGVGNLYKGPVKLSNSGDTLEHQVPSYSWKTISGWNNYSGMVTSLVISEKNIGNRGSKSAIYNNIAVKEQRVDGSWLSIPLLSLRYTLWNIERYSIIKNLSNQINKRRWYSSITHKPTIVKSNLSPWFITGFADAECSFSILIQANSKYATGWRIKPIFAIGLHKKDIEILKMIKYSLGIGNIHTHGIDSIQFRVDSIKELQVVINHFENYPLVTAKLADYILFKKALDIILLKEHLSEKGLLKLVGIKASLNLDPPPFFFF
jgi:hypothetical protein